MSKSVLIVESENDKYFIEALLRYMNLSSVSVGSPICSIDDYECLNGIGNLQKRLQDIKPELKKNGYDRLGIIIDADKEGVGARVELINGSLKNICSDVYLAKINKFEKSAELDVEVGCYIMNVNGEGELETVLRSISSKDSTYADCLDAWRECVARKAKDVSQKEFDKFWVSNYLRFDVCEKEEKRQANIKCSYEASMKKDIWNFENLILNDLKEFLALLAS